MRESLGELGIRRNHTDQSFLNCDPKCGCRRAHIQLLEDILTMERDRIDIAVQAMRDLSRRHPLPEQQKNLAFT